MKRIYLSISILLLVAVSFVFAGCKDSVSLEKDLPAKIQTAQTYLTNNVFYKTAGTDFNSSNSDNYVGDNDFYILVAKKLNKKVSLIKVGDVIYETDKNIEYSVGNSNKLTRKPFFLKDNELYIASLVLLLNANQDGRVTVNFPNDKINSFKIDVYGEGGNKLRASVTNQGTAVLDQKDDGTYTFKSDLFSNSIFIKLFNLDVNIGDKVTIVGERVIEVGKNNQSTIYGFGSPDSPVDTEGYGVVFYPAYNSGQEYTASTPQSHKVQYNIYCAGIGSFHLTINFVNTTE